MMTAPKFAFLPALLALPICAPSNAGTSTASFQASFVIQQSCTIVSQRSGAQVQCSHNTPFLIQQHTTAEGGSLTTITF